MARHVTTRADYVFRTDGTVEELLPFDFWGGYKLPELQKVVGGYIQVIHLGNGLSMVVNEEGLDLDLPSNPAASALADDNLVGDVLVCFTRRLR